MRHVIKVCLGRKEIKSERWAKTATRRETERRQNTRKGYFATVTWDYINHEIHLVTGGPFPFVPIPWIRYNIIMIHVVRERSFRAEDRCCSTIIVENKP
jgi:hypothetical protein